MLSQDRVSLRLFAAFATVALVFMGVTVLANWRSFEIEEQTQEILTNALPSVEHLTAAVDALRDLEAATDDYPELPSTQHEAAREAIDGLWRVVDAELGAYLALPTYSGERDLYASVPAALRDLSDAMQRLFDEVEAGDVARARVTADREVGEKANRTAHLLRALVRFNASEAGTSSTHIEATHRRVVLMTFVLSAVAALVAAAVAVWMWRVLRSHTRLEQAHADLVARRADELEIFGRRVAHDLLSPLSSLTFSLGAFKKVSEGDPKLETALGRARTCVMRAKGLVENVFDFARSGGLPAKDVRADVREVVDQIVEEARAVDPSERPEIVVADVPDVAVKCSRGVLASVLGNLVRNAIKYMSDSAVRHLAIRVAETSDSVRFEVEDTGPGVPPGLEAAIWEPYVRGEGVTQPGLGLGLATVKRFCEAHGGSVGVRSVTGQGAVFFFVLPKVDDASRASLPPVSAKLARVAR
jgi:signal transduction histidine kinase